MYPHTVYDIFISYRRNGGYETAKHLYDLLIRDGYSVSFDLDTLRNGDFDTQLLSRIDECKDFILILNPGAFDRSIDPDFDRNNDWMRIELAEALAKNKNIIPIMLPGFNEYPNNLPADIADVCRKNGPKHSMEYFDEFYRKLKNNFMQSKSRLVRQTPPPHIPNGVNKGYDNTSNIQEDQKSDIGSTTTLKRITKGGGSIVVVVCVVLFWLDLIDKVKDLFNSSDNTEVPATETLVNSNIKQETSGNTETAFDKKLFKEWNFILKNNNRGQILTLMGEAVLHKDFDEFLQYSFNDYVKGQIPETDYLHESDLFPVLEGGFTFEFDCPINIYNNSTSSFLEFYGMIKDSDYSENNHWDPIKDLNEAKFINIEDITVEKDGKRGFLNYTIERNMTNPSLITIEFVKKTDKWKFNNFSIGDKIFTEEVKNYINQVR